MNIVPLNYKGEAVRFNTDGGINATDIASRFGKRSEHGLSNAETLEYVRAPEVNVKILLGRQCSILRNQIQVTPPCALLFFLLLSLYAFPFGLEVYRGTYCNRNRNK